MMQELLDLIAPIGGWLTPVEAKGLAVAALVAVETQDGAFVEVGSWHGKSTVLLAKLLRELAPTRKLWAIDPHRGVLPTPGTDATYVNPSSWAIYNANLQRYGVADQVLTVRQAAEEITWTEPIGFLYIDSLHDYSHVRAHFDVFASSLQPGAVVCFHDYDPTNWPGVVRLVAELEDDGFERLWLAETLMALRKQR